MAHLEVYSVLLFARAHVTLHCKSGVVKIMFLGLLNIGGQAYLPFNVYIYICIYVVDYPNIVCSLYCGPQNGTPDLGKPLSLSLSAPI